MQMKIIRVLIVFYFLIYAAVANAKMYESNNNKVIEILKKPFMKLAVYTRNEWEKGSWDYVTDLVIWAFFDAAQAQMCGFDVTREAPKTVSMNFDELQKQFQYITEGRYPSIRIWGMYVKESDAVFYVKGRYHALVHEYIHAITYRNTADPRIQGTCIHEWIAKLGEKSYTLEQRIKMMKFKRKKIERQRRVR